jgi:hypothetical protein
MASPVSITAIHPIFLRAGTLYTITVRDSFRLVPGRVSNKPEWHEEKDKCDILGCVINWPYTPMSDKTLVQVNMLTGYPAQDFQLLLNNLPTEIQREVAKHLDLDEGKPLSVAEFAARREDASSPYSAITLDLGTWADSWFTHKNSIIIQSYPYEAPFSEPSHLQAVAIGVQELWRRYNEEKPTQLPPLEEDDLPNEFLRDLELVEDIRIFVRFDKPGFKLLRRLATPNLLRNVRRVRVFMDCECVRAGRYDNTIVGALAEEAEMMDFSDGWATIAMEVVDGGSLDIKFGGQKDDGHGTQLSIALGLGPSWMIPILEDDEGHEDWKALLKIIRRTMNVNGAAIETESLTATMLTTDELDPYNTDIIYWDI